MLSEDFCAVLVAMALHRVANLQVLLWVVHWAPPRRSVGIAIVLYTILMSGYLEGLFRSKAVCSTIAISKDTFATLTGRRFAAISK